MAEPVSASAAVTEVSFTMTPRLFAAVRDVVAFYDSRNSPALPPELSRSQLASLRAHVHGCDASSAAPLPLSSVRGVSAGLLFLTRISPHSNSQASRKVAGYVHELLRGSSLAPPPAPAKPAADPALAASLERIRAKVARREIDQLLGRRPGAEAASGGIFSGFSHVTKDLSVAANIILMMVTGYVAMYYVGRMLFQHDPVLQKGFGIIGIVGALVVETVLLAIRDNTQQRWENAQERNKQIKGVRPVDVANAMRSAGLDGNAWEMDKKAEKAAGSRAAEAAAEAEVAARGAVKAQSGGAGLAVEALKAVSRATGSKKAD